MNPTLRRLTATILVLLATLGLTGCGGDSGLETDYSGTWQGRTSHGGTIVFVVDGNAVTSLQNTDPEADVWITQPVAVEGNSFSVQDAEGVSSPTSPAVSVQGTFTSITTATGAYSVTRGSQSVAGTFQATLQQPPP